MIFKNLRRVFWFEALALFICFLLPGKISSIEHFAGGGVYQGYLIPNNDNVSVENRGIRTSLAAEYEFGAKFRKTWLFYADYNLNLHYNPDVRYSHSLFSFGAKYIRDFTSVRLNFREKLGDPITFIFPFLLVFEYASYFVQILIPIHPFAAEGAIIEFNNARTNLGYFLAVGLTTGNIDITFRFNHLFYNTFDTPALVHNLQFLAGISFHFGIGTPAVEWEKTW